MNIFKYENIYEKFRFKVFKFNNFETLSTKFDAPSSPILIPLINF